MNEALQRYEEARILARKWQEAGCGQWYEYYDIGAHIDLLQRELMRAEYRIKHPLEEPFAIAHEEDNPKDAAKGEA